MKHIIKIKKSGKVTGMILFLIVAIVLLLNPNNVNAQTLKDREYKQIKSPKGFIENKGQIIDQDNKLNPDVKYLFNMPGLNVQLKSNCFSYDAYVVEQKKKEKKQ